MAQYSVWPAKSTSPYGMERGKILRVLKRGGVPPVICCGFTPLLSVPCLSTAVWYGIPPSRSTIYNRESTEASTTHHIPSTSVPRGTPNIWIYRTSQRRDHLCSKTFEMIKRPQSRLNHLRPLTCACAHGQSLRFSDRPSIFKCRTERF